MILMKLKILIWITLNMSGKVLITGGLGNLGLWITDYLLKQNYDVTILSARTDLDKTQFNQKLDFIHCDIRDLDNLKKLVPQKLDYVIHLASINEFFLEDYPEKAININSFGTRNLLEILKSRKIKRFVYFSTFHVYGKSYGNISETMELFPKNDYASTHLFAEYYVKQFKDNYNIPYTIFRLTNSYGSPKDINSSKWYLVLNDLSKMAFEKKTIILKSNGKAIRDFIFMGDVAKVVEKSFSFKDNEIYNLGSGVSTSILEIAKMVQEVYFEVYKTHVNIEVNKSDKTEIKNLSVNISKLQKIVNIEFKPYFKEEILKIFNLLETNK